MEEITLPLISVITVSYNCADDLEMTIKNVLAQTYRNVEFIVVDGGSTDATSQVLKQYEPHFSHCVSEPDDGIFDGMNKGIRLASGEWVIMMNAGDRFTDDNVLKDIFSSPIPKDKSFIYGNYFMEYADGRQVFLKTDRSKAVVHHQSAIYRRSLHAQYGYYLQTHPYIVSDLLFFMAIPENQYLKYENPIAIVKAGGNSSAYWVREQSRCVELIFGIHSFPYIIWDYVKMNVGRLLRNLHLRK